MKFVDVKWYCAGHGNVGIVCMDDPHEGTVYYIGQCSGTSIELDIEHISCWGSRFPVDAGNVLFGYAESKHYDTN